MTDTMAEPRRVEFQTISSPKEEKKEKKRPLIPRFSLALGESTASTCPEFSFTELVKKEKAGLDLVAVADPGDPFGGEDDCHGEVAALAQKFEEKYGPKPGKKRKLKCLEDEYFDLGDGYDDNDPFIDNTEAYDEVVPSCLTTKHGGFYINRGTLDFRTLSDQEDSAGEFSTPTTRKRGRPRKILDSDEEEPAEGVEPKKKKIKKKKVKEGMEGEKKKKKRITLGPDGEKILKRRKVINPDKKKKTSPTVKELLKQHTASTATPSTFNGGLDNLIPASSPPNPQGDKSTVQDKTELVVSEVLQDGDERKTNGAEFGQNQLPPDLPADLAATIVGIKQAANVAKESKEGKCKFFSPHVNKLLLEIELASRQLVLGKRTSIYAHLADHLPCGKETLIKRAKKLRENQQDDQLKLPIQHLKEEIDKVMPALQEQHELEVAKSRQGNKEKREGGEPQKDEGGNTESDDEDKTNTPGLAEGHSRKGNRDPRKKFKWTPEIKALLCQIVGIKMCMFDTYKFRSQTAEEYLRTFLENEVKVLWPQGWIQTRMLYKESRAVHGSWTNPTKPKRPVLVSRSTASPTPAISTSMSAISENQPTDSLPPTHPPQSASTATEVIEVSDLDEPTPAPRRDRAKAAATILDVAEESSQARPSTAENLKFSPNSMEAIAAATAAAVAAAVSSPKGETHPSLGERRPHLVSEILKRPGGVDPAAATFPKSIASSGPKTPPTPVTPQGKDVGSPFLAEFSRYLSSSNSSSQPLTSSRVGQSLMAVQVSQLQSKTVSSSTGLPKQHDEKKTGQLPPIHWQVEGVLGADKTRKLAQGASGLPSGVHAAHKGASGLPSDVPAAHKGASGLPSDVPAAHKGASGLPSDVPAAHKGASGLPSDVHAARKVAPLPGSSSLDSASAQRAQYQKMTALLMGHDSPPPQKRRGDVVRDQILSQIEAEIASSKLAKSSMSQPSGDFHGKRMAPVAQTLSRPSTSTSTGLPKQLPISAHPARQSPLPARSPNSQRPSGAVPASRQPPVPVSRQSPTTETQKSAMVASSKQQVAVSRHSPPTVPWQSAAVVSRHVPTAVPRQAATTASIKQQAAASQHSPPTMPRQSATVASSKQQATVSPRQALPPGNSQGLGMLPRGVTSRSLLCTFQSQRSAPSQISPPPSARSAGPIRPPSDPSQKKPAPSSSPSSVSAPPASAHSALPFQRNPSTPASQPPLKLGASQGQSIKVMAGSGQVSPHQPVSAGASLQKSLPTSLTSQGQRSSAAAQPPSNNTSKGQKLPPSSEGSQKLPGGATGSASSGLFRGVALSQSLYQPIERERKKAVQNSRASPGERSGGQAATAAAAQVGSSQASSQGSKSANVAHSRPPTFSHALGNSATRPQEPSSAAAGKVVHSKPPSAHSGNLSTQQQQQSPGSNPQVMVSSGLFNHRPVFRPLHSHTSGPLSKDNPRPPQSFGQ